LEFEAGKISFIMRWIAYTSIQLNLRREKDDVDENEKTNGVDRPQYCGPWTHRAPKSIDRNLLNGPEKQPGRGAGCTEVSAAS